MLLRLPALLLALFATAAQAQPPGAGMVYITGVTVVHLQRAKVYRVIKNGDVYEPEKLMETVR